MFGSNAPYKLSGVFSMRRFGSSRFLIFIAVALTLLLPAIWFSPEWSPAVTSALKNTYDWGASKLPGSTDPQSNPSPDGQAEGEEDAQTGSDNQTGEDTA